MSISSKTETHWKDLSKDNLTKTFLIICPKKEMNIAIEHHVRKKLPTLKKPGFRKGKIPFSHALEMMKNELYMPVIEEYCQQICVDILKENKIQDPIVAPGYQLKTPYEQILQTGGPCEIVMTVHTLPSFDLKKISNIKIKRPIVELADTDVQEALHEIGQRYRKLSLVQRPCRKGDTVALSYSTGSQIKDSDFSQNAHILVGIHAPYIPPLHRALGEQVINCSAGEEKNTTVTFPMLPSGENTSLPFRIRIEKVFATDDPTFDDSLAQRLGIKTLTELKEKLKEKMQETDQQRQFFHMKHEILQHIQQHYRFSIPPLLVKDILDQQEQEHAKKEDKQPLHPRKNREDSLIKNLRISAIFRAFAKEENIALDEKEVKEAIIATMQRAPEKEHPKIQEACLKNPNFLKKVCQPFFEEKILKNLLKKVSFIPTVMTRKLFYAPVAGIE